MKRPLLAYCLGIIVLLALPYFVARGADFSGADGIAQEALTKQGYTPWVEPLFNPPPEVASGLFAFQAALGGLALGFFLGRRARK